MIALLGLLNTALPALIALYKEVRGANPDQPALTDDQIIDLLRTESQVVVDKARAWLDSHPSVP